MDEPSARGQSDGLYRGRSQSLSAGSGRSQRRGEHLQVLSDGHCSREGEGSASAIKIIRLLESKAETQPPTPSGFAEVVGDDIPVLHAPRIQGCLSSQSFWKAGSDRKGSQNGSSLKRAGVTEVP